MHRAGQNQWVSRECRAAKQEGSSGTTRLRGAQRESRSSQGLDLRTNRAALQDSLLLPATGMENLQRSAPERPLGALPSTYKLVFFLCLALNWEVTFLAAFIRHLAISGPVLIQVSGARAP